MAFTVRGQRRIVDSRQLMANGLVGERPPLNVIFQKFIDAFFII